MPTKKRPSFPRSSAAVLFKSHVRLVATATAATATATATAATTVATAAARNFNLLGHHVANLYLDLFGRLVRNAHGVGAGLLLRLALHVAHLVGAGPLLRRANRASHFLRLLLGLHMADLVLAAAGFLLRLAHIHRAS